MFRNRLNPTIFLLLAGASVALAELPPMPATPAAATDLLYARPVRFAQPFEHTWSKEQPRYTDGWLLVIQADPALIFPRQTGMPVLFVGATPAQVLNGGHEDGRVIALVPGPLDLKSALIWFGSPGLPGEITNLAAARERTAAEKAGIRPFSADKVKAALQKGGARLDVNDYSQLGPTLTAIAEEFTPRETMLIDQFRSMSPR
jgi:hypothetical protein